ncbi:MAG: hypothetical protein AVDCRST_MAG18-281 [uncultured Thermomicrobiales bacterium]|uniref:Glycosyltransferase RgtA/B/C/D-like domain-containing protein n=1 Tax=uncultured Thermomicrobiales bacterium TaxID=1645740 RepID=A0A6J4UKM7_9BACT|nr:MAG: hypothetical protein AVDCRST_MAG18-281 [uncultured Thermomicrobiales bacterium]
MSTTRRPPDRASQLAAVTAAPPSVTDIPPPTATTGLESRFDERALRWGRRLLVFLGYCLATVIMTWPWVTRLGSTIPPGGDPLLQVWISRWVQHALATDPLNLYNTNAFYPLQYTLAYSDSNIPAGIMAAPIYLLTGNAILANNLLVLGTFVLAGCGIYALVGLLAGNRAVAFVAGLAYAFLPYRFAHIWHLNQLGHAWTPWAIFALVLLIQRQRWRYAVAFGLLFAVQVLTSFYVGFQIAFAIAIALLVAVVAEPRARSLRFLGQLVAAGALALAIILPLAWPYVLVRDQQGLERTLWEAEQYQATPASYLRVQSGNRFWNWLTVKKGGEDTLFPGGLVTVGAIVGLIGFRRRPAVSVAALALLLFGVVLSLGPTWRPGPDGGVPLPYRFLFDHFPFFKAMRVPARFGALALLALVILAGCGAAWAWERLCRRFPGPPRLAVGAGLTAALAVLVMVELFTQVRLATPDTSAEIAATYRWLAAQPDRDPIIEFPAQTDDVNAATMMYWSTFHWKPIVGGYSGFVPRAHDELIQAFTGELKRPDGSVAKNVSYPRADNIGLLQTLGVRYIVLHEYGYKREDLATIIDQLEATGVVEKVDDFGEAIVYTLNPATEPPLPIEIDLYAPSLAVAGEFWEPAFVARNVSPRQELFFIERPLTLTTTWRDASGKVVRSDSLPLALPAVLPPGDLFCSARACPTAPGATLPETGPESPRLYPEKPGSYTIELAVIGGVKQRRTIPVEVVAAPPDAGADGLPLALVDVTLAGDQIAPGTALDLTMNWETRRALPEDYTLFAQLIGPDGQVWGQYDALAGWTGHYASAWRPGERVSLPWSVPLKADAPPGTYRLLVGMYRRTPTGVERLPFAYPDGDATEYWAGEVVVP